MDKPKLFLSYSHEDEQLIGVVKKHLSRDNYSILTFDDILPGQNWQNAINEMIKHADYYIFFLSPKFTISNNILIETNKILGYIQNNTSKIVLPVLIKETSIPSDLRALHYLDCINQTPENVAKKISSAISQREGRKIAEKEVLADRIEKVSHSIVEYIDPILTDLEKRETKLKRIAATWNFCGYLAIVLGIFASILLVVVGMPFKSDIGLYIVLFMAVKGGYS